MLFSRYPGARLITSNQVAGFGGGRLQEQQHQGRCCLRKKRVRLGEGYGELAEAKTASLFDFTNPTLELFITLEPFLPLPYFLNFLFSTFFSIKLAWDGAS